MTIGDLNQTQTQRFQYHCFYRNHRLSCHLGRLHSQSWTHHINDRQPCRPPSTQKTPSLPSFGPIRYSLPLARTAVPRPHNYREQAVIAVVKQHVASYVHPESRKGRKFLSVRIPCQRVVLCPPAAPAYSPLSPSLLRVACEQRAASQRIRIKGMNLLKNIRPGTTVSRRMCAKYPADEDPTGTKVLPTVTPANYSERNASHAEKFLFVNTGLSMNDLNNRGVVVFTVKWPKH